jgi:hypothetical protein
MEKKKLTEQVVSEAVGPEYHTINVHRELG